MNDFGNNDNLGLQLHFLPQTIHFLIREYLCSCSKCATEIEPSKMIQGHGRLISSMTVIGYYT